MHIKIIGTNVERREEMKKVEANKGYVIDHNVQSLGRLQHFAANFRRRKDKGDMKSIQAWN